MCGIAGIIQKKPNRIDPTLLQRMSQSLKNRGPDDQGFLGYTSIEEKQLSRDFKIIQPHLLYLIHRRLAILDLTSAGWQPMGTVDGKYYIIFNGEIYNYLELQKELKTLGYHFQSHSDTEVLLKAYAQWGKQVLNKLVGMFAFAILDTQANKLFLARDHCGIKPLYYAYFNQGFAFASEIQTLLNIPQISRQVNPQRAYNYLHSGITDNGNETFFADIKQLPSAHYLEISLNDIQPNQPISYWQVELNQPTNLSYTEATEKLREIFLDNIKLHLRSDVPIGTALSGGIDSSAILMSMVYLEGKNIDLNAFSYIASDVNLSEEKWIDLIIEKSGAKVHKIQPHPEDLITDLEDLIKIQGEPFGSSSIYAQYRVFKTAQEAGIKVMLDGQGADELLGGYRPYLAARLASLIRQGKWIKAQNFWQQSAGFNNTNKSDLLIRATGLLIPPIWQNSARKIVGREFNPSWLKIDWFKDNGVKFFYSSDQQITDILKSELAKAFSDKSLPMLLRFEDRNSMTHSIESRVPFLTPNLVDFMFSLPEEFIIASDGTSKAIFRDAMRGIVPKEILQRRDKIGFATPEKQWLNMLQPWVKSILNSDIAQEIPLLNLKIINQQFDAILSGNQSFDFRIWRWINFIKWSECFNVYFGD